MLVLAGLLGAQQQAVTETITPVLLEVRDVPVAFAGSDGKTHLVYELRMTNFSSGNATIEQVEVVGDAGAMSKTMDKSEIAGRLQMAGQRTPTDVLPGSAEASLICSRHSGGRRARAGEIDASGASARGSCAAG